MLSGAGLSPDFAKWELAHYSGRRDAFQNELSIWLPAKDNLLVEVKAERTIKWLGIFFDRKLTFNEHVKRMKSRAEKTINGLSMLANTVRGLSQAHMRILYTSCVVPQFTYGSAIWWTDKKTQAASLETTQNKALRKICAAFKTMPICALQIETACAPVAHRLDLLSTQAALRFNRLSRHSQVLQRLPQEWRGYTPSNPPPPLPPNRGGRTRTPPITRLHKLALRASPTHELIDPHLIPPWRRSTGEFGGRLTITGATKGVDKEAAAKMHNTHIQVFEHISTHLLAYTDGSMLKKDNSSKVGAALVLYHQTHAVCERTIGLGTQAEVYDAEMEGLAQAAREAVMNHHSPIKHLHFYADNTAAIQNIFEAKPRAGQSRADRFRQTILDFLDADPAHTIEVAWAPGHEGVKGNERADKLAKAACSHAGPRWATAAHVLCIAKDALISGWRRDWKDTEPVGRFAPADRNPPSNKPPLHFFNLKRRTYGLVVQTRTGHAFIGEYYATNVPDNDPACPCGASKQTRRHIIQDCPRYDDHQHILTAEVPSLHIADIIGTNEEIAALAMFIEASGAFTKTGEPPTKETNQDDQLGGSAAGEAREGDEPT